MSLLEPEKQPTFFQRYFYETVILSSITAILLAIYIFAYALPVSQSTKLVEKDLKIKGNKNSKIYHLPRCPNYDDIALRNVRWFKTHEEAKSAGYRLAMNC